MATRALEFPKDGYLGLSEASKVGILALLLHGGRLYLQRHVSMSVATGILVLSQHSNVVFGESSQVGILCLPLVFTSAGTPVLEPHSYPTLPSSRLCPFLFRR